MHSRAYLRALRDLLVLHVVNMERKELPLYRFDGEEAGPADVAAELGIPIIEAQVRMKGPKALGRKDLHGGVANHLVQRGVATTIQQRINKFIQRKKRRPLRKRKLP